MTTQFPNNLDTFTNPTANDEVSVVSHADQHANANDAIEALQAKVGINSSLDDTTIDYKLSNVADGDKAVAVADYDSDIAAIESDITDLETADGQNVKITGNQTIAGVKTFTDSPIVPDPTNDTDATNKQWVEDYVEDTGRNTVGLLTPGNFITDFTANLKFSRRQEMTETAMTGSTVSSLHSGMDTIDGTNFIVSRGTGADLYIGEYSKSGSVWSTIFASAAVSAINIKSGSAKVRYIDSGYAIAAGIIDSTDQIYIYLLGKSGSTWSVLDSDTYTMPGPSSSTLLTDIYIDGNDAYIAVSYQSQTVYVIKAVSIPGSSVVAVDGSWTVPTVAIGAGTVAQFNSASTLFLGYADTTDVIQKYSFSSGSISQVGNDGTIGSSGYTEFRVIDTDKVIYNAGGTDYWVTLAFDGTDFDIESKTNSNPTPSISWNSCISVVDSTTIQTDAYEIVLSGTGFENAIEDLDASGYLGYLASSTEAATGTPRDLVISGSTNNDGTYDLDSCTLNKVILDATTQPPVAETEECTVSADLTDRQGYSWRLKGTNFFLGTN